MKKGQKKDPLYNTIYSWKAEDVYYAAAVAKLKDGTQLYGKGWRIESPMEKFGFKDNPSMNERRAKRFAITDVNNTLNVLKLYGKGILEKGDVDPQKVKNMERLAFSSTLNFNQRFELVKFPKRDITFKEARELGLWQ